MKKTLIVVDMQNDFIDMALGTKEAVAIVENVRQKIGQYARRGDEIIFTRDTHGEDYLDTPEGKKLPVPHCIKGSEGWKLDANVRAALEGKEYTVVEKPTFGSVTLPEHIATAEDFSIEMLGLCTDICVVSNALLLKAHFPESSIIVHADLCAGVTPESHAAALTTMKMCQIDVL